MSNLLTPGELKISVEQVNSLWTHRRRITYICLISAILTLILAIFAPLFDAALSNHITAINSLLLTAFITLMSVPLGYLGLATISDIKASVIDRILPNQQAATVVVETPAPQAASTPVFESTRTPSEPDKLILTQAQAVQAG